MDLLSFESARAVDVVYPRHLVAGSGAIDTLGSFLTRLAVPRGPVFVVSDRVLVDFGLVDRATSPLVSAGYEPAVYGDIAGEPDLAVLERLEEAVRASDYVAVVGIGGGSALDPAKLAAAFPTEGRSAADLVARRTVEQPTLPLVLVPTTAGTGAEASRNTIVTHGGRKVVIGSPHLCATAALLDPTLTVTAPQGVTAATGLDALCHAVEATLSTFASPFTTVNALAAARAIARWLPVAYEDGSDLAARRAMLYAAYLAGLAINAVTVLGHSMAYTIATRAHLPHGVTTAMSLPYCIAYSARGAPDRVEALEAEVGAEPGSLAAWARRFCDKLGMPPSLRDVGIGEDELPAMVEECLEKYPRPNSPVELEHARVLELYRHFLDGDVDGAARRMAEA